MDSTVMCIKGKEKRKEKKKTAIQQQQQKPRSEREEKRKKINKPQNTQSTGGSTRYPVPTHKIIICTTQTICLF